MPYTKLCKEITEHWWDPTETLAPKYSSSDSKMLCQTSRNSCPHQVPPPAAMISQSLHLAKGSGKRRRKKKRPIGGLEPSAGTHTNQMTHGPEQAACRSGTRHVPMQVLLKLCTIISLFTCESALPTLGGKCPCSTVYLKFLLSCFSSPWKFILVRFVAPQKCLCV